MDAWLSEILFLFKNPFLCFAIALCINTVSLPSTLVQNTLKVQAANNLYQKIASFQGKGSITSSMVGPGGTTGSQKYYIGYQYVDYSLHFVAIDPNNNYTATTYTIPLATEYAAATMTVGFDNNMYIGTKSTVNSHVLKFNTSTSQLSDAGTLPVDPRTSAKQTYIWEFTLSPVNQRIYGCTYPSADLISYGPNDATPQIVNLGSVDSANQYARFCAADPTSPYVYVGTGSANSKIVAYNIQTKTTSVLAASATSGFGDVWVGSDHKVYGALGNQYYLLSNGRAQVVKSVVYASTNVFSNGDRITFNAGYSSVIITHANGVQNTYPYTYQGSKIDIFRVGAGPDGNIYAGSVLPFYLTKYTPSNPTGGLTNLGLMSGGEPYSMLSYNGKLEIGSYTLPSFISYTPKAPFAVNFSATCGTATNATNPQCINTISNWSSSGGLAGDLRPEALISAPDGNMYAGSIGHYGQLNGPLVKWNAQTGSAVAYYPFSNLGVSSLTVATACKGVTGSTFCLIGGTTSAGGTGSTSTATTSPLFIWNPATNAVVKSFTLPNVPTVVRITDLVTDPVNNYVYGIASSKSASYLFIFNPKTGTFINGGTSVPFYPLYNSVSIGTDGNIWGAAVTGIFRINLTTNTTQLVFRTPQQITAGFTLVKDALNGDKIYVASHSDLYMYAV